TTSIVAGMVLPEDRPRIGPHRERALERLLGRLDCLHRRGAVASTLVTRWRLAVFVVVFAAVARYHNRLEDRLHRLRLWREIKRAHLARVTLNWDEIPAKPAPPVDQHPYAIDLDLVGPHSLLHLLDTTVSSNGRERLSTWLLSQPFDPTRWSDRQALVRELVSLPLLRDRLVLEAKLIGDDEEINGRRLHA